MMDTMFEADTTIMVSMTTLIEFAARAVTETEVISAGDYTVMNPEEVALAVVKAYFPELFSDPPTAWLAPWEATKGMLNAVVVVIDDDASLREEWRSMRDAHLKDSADPT